MEEFIKKHTDIQQTLSSTDFGPLTALLISDSAFNALPDDTINNFQLNNATLSMVMFHF